MANIKKEGPVNILITNALCELINENKPYNDITVQDIIKKAGVCRKSFYRNFKTKDDILEIQFKEICNEISVYFKSNCPETFSGLVYAIFYISKSHREYILCFYKGNQKLYFGNIVETLINSKIFKDEKTHDPNNYYYYVVKVWMVIGILSSWLERNCDLPIEDIVKLVKSYQVVKQ